MRSVCCRFARRVKFSEQPSLRFRLHLFLRQISPPAYYAYHMGDEVQLSAEIMPVRVK
jgi:hypothetical protein